MDVEQQALFSDNPDAWREDWEKMPEFNHSDLSPVASVKVNFASLDDLKSFGELVGQKLTTNTRSIWFPKQDLLRYADKLYRAKKPENPQYPVYIISKGRADSRYTAKSLDAIGVPFKIVVELQEYDQYAAVIDPTKILVLPFSNLGQGSIPARNWVWEHAFDSGAARHWILDDNIRGFFYFNRNLKMPVGDGTIFHAAEQYADRFENVALAGFNYRFFVKQKGTQRAHGGTIPPFYLNTRIYSCILINNMLPFRWRGRYNEDTDLSLRVLKAGYCTVLFNAFLCGKEPTMTMKGGNTDELYEGDGRLKMAESLREQHPDVVTITQKFGRPQHQVNYKPFARNKLIPASSSLECKLYEFDLTFIR